MGGGEALVVCGGDWGDGRGWGGGGGVDVDVGEIRVGDGVSTSRSKPPDVQVTLRSYQRQGKRTVSVVCIDQISSS